MTMDGQAPPEQGGAVNPKYGLWLQVPQMQRRPAKEETLAGKAKKKVVVKESEGSSRFHVLRDIDDDELTTYTEVDVDKEGANFDVNLDPPKETSRS